jgi:hypothetical protein
MTIKTGDLITFHSAQGPRYAFVTAYHDEDTISLVYVEPSGRVENHAGVRREGAPERHYVPTDAERTKLQGLIEDGRQRDAAEFEAFITRPMGSTAGAWSDPMEAS